MDQIRLIVDNSSTLIADPSRVLRGPLYQAFKKELSYQPEDYLWRQGNNPHWDGYISCVCYSKEHCKCAVKKDGIHFPTGLISKATAHLRTAGVSYSISDVRAAVTKRQFDFTLSKIDALGNAFELFDYQRDAVGKAIDVERGLIKIATGGGKTRTAAAIIAELGVLTIFYVTSNDLLHQAKKDIEEVVQLQGKFVTVGQIGGGKKEFGDITVMTVQTAVRALGEKYKKFDDEDEDDSTNIEDIKPQIAELIRSAKCCVCDEVQHWRAETCQIIADNSFSCRYRYGLSATPWRDAGDDILIDACFGRLICDIPASYLIRRNFLVKPYIAFVPIKNLAGEKFGPYPTTYKQGIVENTFRNEWIAGLAKKLSDSGRITLILVQQIAHGEELARIIPDSVFLHGSSGKANRLKHIKAMQTGQMKITIASTIFDEGIDVKPLNALIQAGGGKSPTRALQRVGRVIRNYTYPDGTKKKNAFVYDLHDHLKYLSQHSMARRRIYKTEPEFDIRDIEI